MVHIGNDWDEILKAEFSSDYYLRLREFLKVEYRTQKVYPPMECIFNALRYTSFENTKVVILGQDPYHGAGQAHGLCFSVQKGVDFPPSLRNIFEELKREFGMPTPVSGELTGWAEQGVLLLNTTLTVREGCPQSHLNQGWETLTDHIIQKLNQKQTPIVFLLWGGNARSKAKFITNPKHLVLESAHPSPLSVYRGFFGNMHFTKANEYLKTNNIAPIEWEKTV